MVIWITGLSGAGKTTLCQALYQLLKPHLPQVVLLDGDAVRAVFDQEIGYREVDRLAHVRRIQRLAKLLSDQGQVVLVAVLYSHPDLLGWNREQLQPYVEVYLRAPLEVLRQRDTKDLYAKALAGERVDVVGIDIPWHAPQQADLVVDMEDPEPPERLARTVIAAIPRLRQTVDGAYGHALHQ